MATGSQVVEGGLKLLGVKTAESPLSPAEIQDGLVSLNDMMSEWEEDGIYTGFVPLSDKDDILNVPDSALGAIKAGFALYVAPEYDRVITPTLERRARSSMTSLRASLVLLDGSEFPDTLPVGSGNRISYGSSDGDSPNSTDQTFYPDNFKRNF